MFKMCLVSLLYIILYIITITSNRLETLTYTNVCVVENYEKNMLRFVSDMTL